jgi:hypothetical protein
MGVSRKTGLFRKFKARDLSGAAGQDSPAAAGAGFAEIA